MENHVVSCMLMLLYHATTLQGVVIAAVCNTSLKLSEKDVRIPKLRLNTYHLVKKS